MIRYECPECRRLIDAAGDFYHGTPTVRCVTCDEDCTCRGAAP